MASLKRFLQENPWGQAISLVVGWNIALRFFIVLGYFVLSERYAPLSFLSPLVKSNFLLWSSANFDGEHYLSIAKFGYMIRNGFPQYAFFPLLPSLIHLVALVVRDYWVAGMIVTQSALVVAMVYLRKWAAYLKLPDIRLLLLVSSGGIFLASIYTEPVFIALAAMIMYFSERKWWGRATLLTALVTATRVNGLFLALFLLVKMVKARRSLPLIIRDVAIGFAGILSYMVFLWQKTGDPLNWFHAQGAWGKAVATSPLTTALSYFRAVTTEFHPDLTHLVVVIEVLTTLIALSLFIVLLRRRQLDLAYWLYLAGNIAMPLATGSLGSMPRFFLTLFPLLVVIPSVPKLGKVIYYVCTVTACLIGIVLFTRGYWYG